MRKERLRAGVAAVMVATILFALVAALGAQEPGKKEEVKNPLAGDAAAIRRGGLMFRQECVYCHGLGAHGGARAPDLTTGAWVHGGSDADLQRTIREGVPGSGMPGNGLEETEIWQLVAYLRSIQAPTPPARGDAKHGEQIFSGDGNCSLCHMVSGRGGRLGPELSRIGSARPRAYLIESIREPDKIITQNHKVPAEADLLYDTVLVVTRDGKTIKGIALNEDTFSLQLMDETENLHSFRKRDLKSVKHEPKSLMPAYKADTLSDSDLDDVVAYLQSLRGPRAAAEVSHAK